MKTILAEAAFVTLLTIQLSYGQQPVRMTAKFGSANSELQDILYFQNISIEKLIFTGEQIKGKFYEITIKEFRNGALTNSKILFDGAEMNLFRIDSTQLSLKVFTSTADNKLTTWIRGNRFSTRKEYFGLESGKGEYVLKDFFGGKKSLDVSSTQEFPVLAIITPTMHKDGSGSYCEVVQSNVKPEDLGEHFKIPHYFLIMMKFK